MNHDTLSEQRIETARSQIESFLSRSLDVREVTPVPADEVTARGPIGGNAGDEAMATEVHFRISINPEDDILDPRKDMVGYLREQFITDMEQNSPAPDTQLVVVDYPPEAYSNKPLVFYVRSTL